MIFKNHFFPIISILFLISSKLKHFGSFVDLWFLITDVIRLLIGGEDC
jgi:hypothetical protein